MAAAILLSDCTVTTCFTQGVKVVKIVTPNTADDTDTIDVSSLFDSGCFQITSNATDKQVLGAGVYGTTITLGGATDNEARTIICIGW